MHNSHITCACLCRQGKQGGTLAQMNLAVEHSAASTNAATVLANKDGCAERATSWSHHITTLEDVRAELLAQHLCQLEQGSLEHILQLQSPETLVEACRTFLGYYAPEAVHGPLILGYNGRH